MNHDQFQRVRENIAEARDSMLTIKWRDYRGVSPDLLANFKDIAAELGITPIQVLGVYMNKHVKAINKFIRCPDSENSEPIQGRIIDNMNYLDLLAALIVDDAIDELSVTGKK